MGVEGGSQCICGDRRPGKKGHCGTQAVKSHFNKKDDAGSELICGHFIPQ